MKKLLGILFILGGLGLGIYVGLWLCFIGGIVGLIETLQSGTVVAMDVAWDIAKIIFASVAGSLTGLVPIFIGQFLLID